LRSAFKKRRCMVLADGFLRVATERQDEAAVAYELDGGKPFARHGSSGQKRASSTEAARSIVWMLHRGVQAVMLPVSQLPLHSQEAFVDQTQWELEQHFAG
jgi:putative SOS response-associated peptidase YedK